MVRIPQVKTLLNLSFHAVYLLIVVLLLIWGSLFITILNQSHRLQILTDQNQQLTREDKQLGDQNKILLQQLNNGVDSLHSQINCVLEFFAQDSYTRANTTISDPNQCVISSSGGTAVPKPQGATNAPNNNGTTSTTTPASPSPPPANNPSPRQNFIQKLIHGIKEKL